MKIRKSFIKGYSCAVPNDFFYRYIYTFKQRNTSTRYVNINVPGIQVKKGLNKEFILICEIMLISLSNLGEPFLTWETCIYKQNDKNNHYTKNHIQELRDKKCKY